VHRFPIPAIELGKMVEERLGPRGGEQNNDGWFACSTYGFGRKGSAVNSRRRPTLIRGKVLECILCGQAITVVVANLLEYDHAFFVEDER
jgi:hypothetical protein